MAELIKCFECGAEVSSEAGECPKCKNPIHGYQCSICRKKEKLDSLKRYRYWYEDKDIDGYTTVSYGNSLAHSECVILILKELSVQYTCPLCEKYSGYFPIITMRDSPHCKIQCKNCGHPVNYYITNCDSCRFPLITTTSVVLEHRYCFARNYTENFNFHYYNEKMRKNGLSFVPIKPACLDSLILEYNQPSTSNKKNDACFLATVLYGEDSSKVQMLCFFRDEYLSASSLGRAFIALYVRLSPPLARTIAKESLLRTFVRYCIVAPALLFTEKFLAYIDRKDKLKQ